MIIIGKDKIDDFGPYLIFFVKSTLELLKEVGRLVGWMLTVGKRDGLSDIMESFSWWKASRTVGGQSDMTEISKVQADYA